MSSAFNIVVPTYSPAASTISKAEIAEIKFKLGLLEAGLAQASTTASKAVSTDVKAEIDELKKFTDFLKFRIEGLDTRIADLEKSVAAVAEIKSKMNIMEITMTALSAALKKD